MTIRANPFRALPVLVAFALNVVVGPLAPVAHQAVVRGANDIPVYDQCQIGKPRPVSPMDCDSWINGILNATQNEYSEDDVVPQRLVLDFGNAAQLNAEHSIQIQYMARKDSSAQHHAYDYLATWNYTFIDADECLGLNPNLCVPDDDPTGADAIDIPSDTTEVPPGGPQPTSEHESLPATASHPAGTQRQFVAYGAELTDVSAITHTTDPAEPGSDYGVVTVTFELEDPADTDGKVMILFGGHLAAGLGERGWGKGLGAASISGGPYHIRLTAVDDESIGNRDNQIMSNAITPLFPSLEILKTADAASVSAGSNIGFTVTVGNQGPGVANNVTLSDPLPAGDGVNWAIDPAYSGPGSCSITGNPPAETLSCSFGNMEAGASASVHVQSATTAASCGEYPNTATADADNFEPVQASASASVLCPDLAITKTTSTPTIYAGQTAVYTITVGNTGSGTATGVTINDTLPTGLTWVEDPDRAECQIAGGNGLSCSGITIAPAGSFSVTVKGVTDAGDCPSILNRATFGSGNDGSGASHPEGQGAQVTVLCPDVGVQKTAFASPINAGDEAHYTITVTAGGAGTSQNVTLHDDLPAVAGTWAAAIQSPDGDDSCSLVGLDLDCSFGDMNPGDSKVVVLTYTTAAADCGTLLNDVFVSSDLDTDQDAGLPGNQVLDVPITVNCGDLVIRKTPDLPADPGGTVNAGGVATFTIEVENDGAGIARNVTLEDYTLPATANGWNLGSAFDEEDCTLDADDELDCAFGDLAAGASVKVQLWTTTTLEDCGTLSNPTAQARSTNDGNPTDSGAILVTCPALEISKSTSTPVVTAGDQVFYTVAVSNEGGDGTAENVVISDVLPSGLAWAEDPASDECEISAGVLSCTVDIPAGESFSVTVSGRTDADDCPSILNRATYTSDNAGSGQSHAEGEGVLVTINCPDVGVDKTADASPINAGDDAGYAITVTAGGSGTSTNVTLHDDLPQVDGAWSYQVVAPDADDACQIVGLDLDCSFGDMEPGDQKVVSLSHTTTPDDCGTLLNDAFVDADVNVDDGNDAALDVAVAIECPDVDVDKTGSGTVNATDSVWFEITVSNDGDGDAYDFEFGDTLPDVAGGWTLVQPAEDGCSLSGLALDCTKPVFAAGDTFTLRVEAETEFADCGELENLASASASNEADGNLGNNSDGHTTVVECPDLDAFKAADDEIVSAGQPIGFTITVENDDAGGTGTAYDVELSDPLPAGSGLDWAMDPADADCQITGAPGTQLLECDFGDLEPGDSVSVHVLSDTEPADCATYPNVATVSAANHPTLEPDADVTVECPRLNISKLADDGTMDAGELASYTMVVWNAGPGTALDAGWSDELPRGVSWSIQLLNADPDDACSSSVDAEGNQAASCTFGDLPPSSMADGKRIVVSGLTDREDCGVLDNTAFAFADNDDSVQASASIEVRCPLVAIEKVNDQPDPVLPGTVVSYTLTVTVSDGPAEDVVVTDELPLGLDAPTSISDGGTYHGGTRRITWPLGDLDDGAYQLTYQAAVSAASEHGDELVNVALVTSPNSQCPDAVHLAPECDDDSVVTVRVPRLVIDKAADSEVVQFVFDAEGNVLSVEPEQVTWTLTYGLTNGPVTNAVISDPLPDFLTFVSASEGGVYDDAGRTITWELGTLTESGSVTFVTTVDADAPEVEPIVNVATIVSDQTPEDDGQDEIRVTSQSQLGGTPTPKPSVPDTALVMRPSGGPLTVPVELMVAVFIGSLGTLALANVRAVRRRR